MRDVPWGWLMRYMHSTGASAFFIVVYLHMFQGLMYGSYRKPRELVWVFGCAIFLCLMAEAFMGYLLPWGQMSYWGAQVIVNLFAAIPFIGPDLALLIRGDYVVSDATLNRFFSFHVIAVPLVLLGLVVAHLIALHEVGSNNPDGVEIKANRRTPTATRSTAFLPSVLHGARHLRRGGVPDDLLGGDLLRARSRRLLPGVQQLHPGRLAEDAAAHRAGLVLHAVLFDAARHHRRHGQRVRLIIGLAAILNFVKGKSGTALKIAIVVVAAVAIFLLKAFDAKFWGVVVMGGSVIILFFLPWLDHSPKSSRSATVRAGTSMCTACSSVLPRARLPGHPAPVWGNLVIGRHRRPSRRSARCSTSASSC
jgi:ubiquinol-cytochrome c reductase cytochrome b subunit